MTSSRSLRFVNTFNSVRYVCVCVNSIHWIHYKHNTFENVRRKKSHSKSSSDFCFFLFTQNNFPENCMFFLLLFFFGQPSLSLCKCFSSGFRTRAIVYAVEKSSVKIANENERWKRMSDITHWPSVCREWRELCNNHDISYEISTVCVHLPWINHYYFYRWSLI